MTPKQCGDQHAESDPQFIGNHTVGGWETTVNHEIDIEIPANCAATPNVAIEMCLVFLPQKAVLAIIQHRI